MPSTLSSHRSLRFGVFEVHVHARELRKKGSLVKLQRQPFELLLVLLDRPGQVVSRAELRDRLWATDVNVDFDHNLNKAVVKLREALGDSSECPLYVETLPRIGYRFIAQLNGTPNGQLPLGPVAADGSQSPTVLPVAETLRAAALTEAVQPLPAVKARRSRPRLILAIGLVLATLIGFAVVRLRRHPALFEPIHSLAVLPLDNISGDPEQDYLAQGMTDELITMLAKNSTLRIISRTSVMQYKGVHRPLPEIARELGVDGILEGSARRAGGRVHLSVQLIHAPSDTHVWAESYNRAADDAVSLPLEAAETIAKQLHSAVLQPTSERFVRPEAHDAYLRGRYMWFKGNNEEAGKYFREATELQPNFALGWSGLSIYYGVGSDHGEMNPVESLPQLKAAAVKAVQLDDQLPEAHLALGTAFFLADWDWDRALQEISRAIQLNSNYSEAYRFRAKILVALNRFDEAIAAQKQATEIDPFARPEALGRTYMLSRQYDAAISDVLQRLRANPSDPGLHEILSYSYYGEGMKKQAMQEYAKDLSLIGDEQSAENVRRAYQRGGWNAMVHWQLSHFEKSTRYFSPAFLAYDYAQLGDKEKSLALLEEGYRQRSPILLRIQNYPVFDPLHADERYRSIIKRIGLPTAY